MRRAYNSGNWEKARFYANKLITKKGEDGLAKSVIVRSYWNQRDLEKLGELLAVWKDSELDFIRKKYEKVVKKKPMKKRKMPLKNMKCRVPIYWLIGILTI